MRKAGFEPDVRRTVKDRVRLNLAYMVRRGKVRKTGKKLEARWSRAQG
jgi:hypothetical protein